MGGSSDRVALICPSVRLTAGIQRLSVRNHGNRTAAASRRTVATNQEKRQTKKNIRQGEGKSRGEQKVPLLGGGNRVEDREEEQNGSICRSRFTPARVLFLFFSPAVTPS